jgi:hypothetical protein
MAFLPEISLCLMGILAQQRANRNGLMQQV